MLVLSRKRDESIRLGDDVIVTVVEIQDGHVKLGITAPKQVRVLRSELYNGTNGQNPEPAATAASSERTRKP